MSATTINNRLKSVRQVMHGVNERIFGHLSVNQYMIMIAVISVSVLMIVAGIMFVMIHKQVAQVALLDAPVSSGQATGQMRMYLGAWQGDILAHGLTSKIPNTYQGDAQAEEEEFYQLMQGELDWYADHEQTGVDYLAQLQGVAEQFEALKTFGENMLNATPSQSGAMVEQFNNHSDALMLDLTGLAAQQEDDAAEGLSDLNQQATRMLYVIGLLLLCIACVFIAGIYMMNHAVRQRLNPCLNVIERWASDTMMPRVTCMYGAADDPFTRTAWAINEFGDLVEVFLRETRASLEAMAAGNTDRRIDDTGFTWEMKGIAKEINANIDHVVEVYMKADADQQNLDQFQQNLNIISQSLAGVADEMGTRGHELLSASEKSSEQINEAVNSATQVSENMSSAAAAVEQITTSIADVSHQVHEASGITGEAVNQAQDTRKTMEELSEASEKIGEIVAMIGDIAAQTRMLSMNATIEAARAGEAGKGFSVVADEVKSLAAQTANAAEEIAGNISAIQEKSQEGTRVIGVIADTIVHINNITESIERVAAEQEQAAQGISANVNSATLGAQEVTSNLGEVSKTSDSAHEDAQEMDVASQRLRQSIDELGNTVSEYVGEAESDDIELF